MAGSPGGHEVARISVKVVPDTSDFHKKLKTFLDKEEKKNKLNINVELDTTKAEAQLKELAKNLVVKLNVDINDKAARAKLESLGKNVTTKVKADVDEAKAKAKLDDLRKAVQAHLDVKVDDAAARAQIAKLQAPVQKKINVILDTAKVGASATIAEITRDREVKIDAVVDDLKARIELDLLARERKARIRVVVDKSIATAVRSIDAVSSGIVSVGQGAVTATKSLGKLSFVFSGLSKVLSGTLKSLKFTAIASGIILLAVSLAKTAGTLVQLTAGIAPVTGILALLPGLALGAATAFGTLKLATSGVGSAIGDVFSTAPNAAKKLAADLQNLAPAARGFVLEIQKLKPALEGIKNSAQQALFAPLTGQLTAVAKVISGPLRQGLSQVAGQFGLAGKAAAEFVRQSQTVALLKNAFATTAESIHLMLPALQPLLAGFRSLAAVGLSFLPGIAAAASKAATSFGQWMQQISASGKAAQWISAAIATLKQLGTLLANVGGIIGSVLRAASASGSQFLGVIGAALAQFNAFLKTAAGQSALQSIFQGLAAIGTALGPVIAALVTGIGTLAKPLVQLAQLIGPILTTAITALAPALASLMPGITALFTGFGKAVELVAPALMPLAKALGQIGIAIGPVLPLLGSLIGQLVSGLAPILGQLIIALSPLLKVVVQLAGAFTPLIPPLAQIIVQLVNGLVPIFVAMEPVVARLIGIIGQFLVTALQMLVTAIVPLLPVIKQVALQIGGSLIKVLIALAPALLEVLQALLPLLPSLLAMTPVLVDLAVQLTPLVVLLLRLATAILKILLPPLVTIVAWLLKFNATVWGSTLGAVTSVVSAISRLPGKIKGALSDAGNWLFNAGRDALLGFWHGILSVEGWLESALWNLFKSIVPGPIRSVLNSFGAVDPNGLDFKGFDDSSSLLPMGGLFNLQADLNGMQADARKLTRSTLNSSTKHNSGLSGALGAVAQKIYQFGDIIATNEPTEDSIVKAISRLDTLYAS